MTKRARLTTQEVLHAIDYPDEEDDFDVDDPDEPFMYGSDDDFSDLNGEDNNDDLDDNMDVSPPYSPLGTPPGGSSPGASPDCSPPSTSASLPRMWTTSLQSVTIQPFQSQVGPTVPIPESPLEVFQLLFTTSLMQMIVDESNR